MSLIRTIELCSKSDNLCFISLIEFFQRRECKVDFDGALCVMGFLDNMSDYMEIQVLSEDPYSLLKQLYANHEINAFTMLIAIGDEVENITVFESESSISITLNGPRQKIDSIWTDYGFYLKNLVMPILDEFDCIASIKYSDCF